MTHREATPPGAGPAGQGTPTNQGEIITAHFNGVTAFDGFQLFNSGGGNFTASAKVYGKG